MKTKQDLQAAVDDIRIVCKKHGIAIVGTCSREGIYGEITIGEATEEALGWEYVAESVNNIVTPNDDEEGFSVRGIGDIKEPK